LSPTTLSFPFFFFYLTFPHYPAPVPWPFLVW
jgi:hypothetical protein